jgi:hypothetical protein
VNGQAVKKALERDSSEDSPAGCRLGAMGTFEDISNHWNHEHRGLE